MASASDLSEVFQARWCSPCASGLVRRSSFTYFRTSEKGRNCLRLRDNLTYIELLFFLKFINSLKSLSSGRITGPFHIVSQHNIVFPILSQYHYSIFQRFSFIFKSTLHFQSSYCFNICKNKLFLFLNSFTQIRNFPTYIPGVMGQNPYVVPTYTQHPLSKMSRRLNTAGVEEKYPFKGKSHPHDRTIQKTQLYKMAVPSLLRFRKKILGHTHQPLKRGQGYQRSNILHIMYTFVH